MSKQTSEKHLKPPQPKKGGAKTRILSHALVRKKWFLPLLIGLPTLCFALIVAAIILGMLSTGVISLGGGDDKFMVGFPNRSSQSDLYLLELGDEQRDGTLLAEQAIPSFFPLTYYLDNEYYSLGNQYNFFGGFVPDQNLLVFEYVDEDGDLNLLRQKLNQDTPTPIFDTSSGTVSGRIFNDGQDIYIRERVGSDSRCYISHAGEAAQRITKGENCSITRNGAYLLTWQQDDNETQLTIMDLDGTQEVTLIDDLPNIDSYRVSFDGSRIAYLTTAKEQQIILINGRNGEVISQGEPVFQVLSYSFAPVANQLIYISENDEGELETYLLDDSGSRLIASSYSLQAEISQDGDYVVYLVKDEDQNDVIYSYRISNGQSTEVLRGEGLKFSLEDRLKRIIISQQEKDELTIYSAELNGNRLVNLFNEDDTTLVSIVYYPDRSGLFIITQNYTDEFSIYYTPLAEAEGYYLLEEYDSIMIRDISSNGDWLLAFVRENEGDDQTLLAIKIGPEQKPHILDESEEGFQVAVFSEDGSEAIYTILTGINPDDCEIRRVAITGSEEPETLYEKAFLIDVQWVHVDRARWIYFPDPMISTSYCPGAPAIIAGNTMEGILPEIGEICYRFRSEANQVYTFNVTSDDFDAVLELYDREGYLLDEDDDHGPGNNPHLVTSLPEAGVYYLKITTYDAVTGRYSISMEEGMSDASQAIPLESNVVTRDYINSTDDIYLESTDYSTYGVLYYFDGKANERIKIDVIASSQGSSIDPFTVLYSATMEVLISDDDSGPDYDSEINFILPETGRYYILVEDLGGNYGPERDYWFDILLSR